MIGKKAAAVPALFQFLEAVYSKSHRSVQYNRQTIKRIRQHEHLRFHTKGFWKADRAT
jgi:hypothetical protein